MKQVPDDRRKRKMITSILWTPDCCLLIISQNDNSSNIKPKYHMCFHGSLRIRYNNRVPFEKTTSFSTARKRSLYVQSVLKDDYLGPDNTSGAIWEVESINWGVLFRWWEEWTILLKFRRELSSFCHSSHLSAKPSPSSICNTSDIFGRSTGELCVQSSATWIICSSSSST